MDETKFVAEIERLRRFASEIDEAVQYESGAQPCWLPLDDKQFWEILDRIEAVGLGRSGFEADAEFLVGLVLIDDFGSLGRDLILARASLLAVTHRPAPVRQLLAEQGRTFSLGNSVNRRKGMLKLIDAAAVSVPIKPLVEMLKDSSEMMRSRARILYDKILMNSGS